MSAHLETDDRSLRLGNLRAIDLSVLRATYGFEEAPQPVNTANVNTVNVRRSTRGLSSLLGKYNDDPSWDDFSAFLEHYRREIDEMNR